MGAKKAIKITLCIISTLIVASATFSVLTIFNSDSKRPTTPEIPTEPPKPSITNASANYLFAGTTF